MVAPPNNEKMASWLRPWTHSLLAKRSVAVSVLGENKGRERN